MDVYWINCLLAVLLTAKVAYDHGKKVGMNKMFTALTQPTKAGTIKETSSD